MFYITTRISKNQLDEMYKYNVCLVVPEKYKNSFPIECRTKFYP
ncbi:MAG: hypothetical protein IPH46_17365 [Bacteroidetes bacterium]|nr:hypothetical protein [Bacteroidota bacterium]